ncbi:ATP-binding domain-containing protein [Fulvivirga sp.]|uniref:ATP-dependent DNA helicase n=1 Tax=Fulvivirga sp. TaxID=1931237 RepID=UPI0032EAB948
MPKPSEILFQKFPFEPTQGQLDFFQKVDQLIDNKDLPVLMVRGFAGTGKTTIVTTLVQVLPLFNYKFSLLAPTGRAAKVMSSYCKRMAFTIHKKIYKQVAQGGDALSFKKQKNYAKNTVFIVDEASMISEDAGFGKSGLLSDLISFIFSDSSNKLILIGDNAQLPPVGQLLSPALNADYLKSDYKLDVEEIMLTEVMRQEQESGILFNATNLRNLLTQDKPLIQFNVRYPDIFKMTGERLEDGLRYAYDNYGIENTMIICRSNKSANGYNQYIRNAIQFYESEIEAGEYLMVVRNNYVHSPDEVAGDFIANGDFVEILKIISFDEMYGFRFAKLQLRLLDSNVDNSFEAMVMLDTLYSEAPSLTSEQNQQLYAAVSEDYGDMSRKELREALKRDPYLNALQVKFAYAITCHKAQGGQWPIVFVDQGYLKEDSIDKEYVRWLYTAITRASEQLFLVNFDKKLFV